LSINTVKKFWRILGWHWLELIDPSNALISASLGFSANT